MSYVASLLGTPGRLRNGAASYLPVWLASSLIDDSRSFKLTLFIPLAGAKLKFVGVMLTRIETL